MAFNENIFKQYRNTTYTSIISWKSLHNRLHKEKTRLFNSFFIKQCSVITNNSKLPTSPSYLTHKRLSTITFSAEDIGKIIQSLNPNKAHGQDNLSICMLKLCGDAICEPLQLIFNQALVSGSLPCDWKKANIVPIHKKGNKQSLELSSSFLAPYLW